MTDAVTPVTPVTNDWHIPPSVLDRLARTPGDRPVALLLRHSVRDRLPPDGVGYSLPITDAGRRLAREMGSLLAGRLQTLHTSPLARCVQTAEALREGAGAHCDIDKDRLLGDPGAYVLDPERAWSNWQELGHEGVIEYLMTGAEPRPGMARPADAARALVRHMLSAAGERVGVHVFVTHDSLVTATAARALDRRLAREEWPQFLECAFFWPDGRGYSAAYREYERRDLPFDATL